MATKTKSLFKVGKTYPTVGGKSVKIVSVRYQGGDRTEDTLFPIMGIHSTPDEDTVLFFSSQGKSSKNDESWDLLSKIPSKYDNLKIGQPVLVKNETYEGGWRRRYFAGVSPRGEARTIPNGLTSWSYGEIKSTYEYETWKHCKPEESALSEFEAGKKSSGVTPENQEDTTTTTETSSDPIVKLAKSIRSNFYSNSISLSDGKVLKRVGEKHWDLMTDSGVGIRTLNRYECDFINSTIDHIRDQLSE